MGGVLTPPTDVPAKTPLLFDVYEEWHCHVKLWAFQTFFGLHPEAHDVPES
jgi:hypothetical protein